MFGGSSFYSFQLAFDLQKVSVCHSICIIITIIIVIIIKDAFVDHHRCLG